MDNKQTSYQKMAADRILLELLSLEYATSNQLAEQLPEISPGSIYRVLKQLLDCGKIVVIRENKIRGSIEKVYALSDHSLALPNFDALNNTRYLQAVASYYTGVLDSLRRFALYSEEEPEEDGAFFLALPVMLSKEEALELAEKVSDVVAEFQQNRPCEQRKMLSVSFLISPAVLK